jgi:hypothetical protein
MINAHSRPTTFGSASGPYEAINSPSGLTKYRSPSSLLVADSEDEAPFLAFTLVVYD